MAKYKLGEICEIVSGSTPKTGIAEYWDGNLKWITPAEIDDESYIITDSARKLTELGVKKTGLSPFPSGTVILSSRAPIGKVAIAGCEMYCNQGFKNLICSDRINNRYLYWFLKGNTAYLNSLGRGATFKEISKKIVSDIEINVPEISQQLAAVDALERVSEIIRLRKNQLQKLDELVKARFVELFGSPCINSKGFQTQKGSSLFKISNGRAVPNDRRFETGIPAYGGNGISWYTDDILCKNDTIVIGRVGFQSGNVHLVKGPVWITDNAMYISELYDDNLSLVFLCAMMEHIDFTKQQDAGDLKKVTQKPFMETEYILPPKSLQEKYISFVEQVDKSKLSPYRDCWTRCNFCLAVWCDNTSNKEDIMEWLMNLDPSIWAALIGAVGAIIVALIKVIIPLFKKKEKASDKVAPSINQTVTGNGNTVIGIQNNMKGEKDGQ